MGQGKTLMIQGASSDAGKSMLVTGLCAYYRRQGVRVAPFKAWNMSLNSFVTPGGGEIGFAQGLQAQAAGIPATEAMNPFLLKPRGDGRVQVIMRGAPWKDITPGQLAQEERAYALEVIGRSLAEVAAQADLVIIEGAGSPAEINVRPRDLANMETAFLAAAPVLLVGDFQRGGVTQLVGTWELLAPRERQHLRGWVANRTLPGADTASWAATLEAWTGRPLVGQIPQAPAAAIQAEDAASLAVGAGVVQDDFAALAQHVAAGLQMELVQRIIDRGVAE